MFSSRRRGCKENPGGTAPGRNGGRGGAAAGRRYFAADRWPVIETCAFMTALLATDIGSAGEVHPALTAGSATEKRPSAGLSAPRWRHQATTTFSDSPKATRSLEGLENLDSIKKYDIFFGNLKGKVIREVIRKI